MIEIEDSVSCSLRNYIYRFILYHKVNVNDNGLDLLPFLHVCEEVLKAEGSVCASIRGEIERSFKEV
jgi:hypothetical protein